MSEWTCGPKCPFWSPGGRRKCFRHNGALVREGDRCLDDLSFWEAGLLQLEQTLAEAQKRVVLYRAAIAARKEKEAQE